MHSISVFRGSNLTDGKRLLVMSLIAAGLGVAAPAQAANPPPPDVALKLNDGRFLHLAPLPFGALAGVPVGAARFDASGTRALLLAEFPGGAIRGDWRGANPTFAYVVDAQRRTLTQLSADGHATAVSWSGESNAKIRDASHGRSEFAIAPAQAGALPPGRLLQSDAVPDGSVFISAKATDRLAVYKTPAGRYIVMQIGARRFRIGGAARNGAYAIIGGYLAWIDGQRHIPQQVARAGPDPVEPLSFAGSPYGDALMPIAPLGNPVYQTAYRNGVAYFSFSYGVQRTVVATTDLINYWFPQLPHDPVFTVGDGLGASPDGALYFIRPEEDVMLFTRKGRYVRARMTGLDAARDVSALTAAMRRLNGGAAAALEPSDDALDAALLQWRFYPVGDASGERWIGSRLGRLLVGDRSGHFSPGSQPAFPFAMLGRTDDGRLWGTSPLARFSAHGSIVGASSALWTSRDGATWQQAATISGDAGAVGAHGGDVWVALTRPWHGRPMVALWRLSRGASSDPLPTGGTYAGEQLAFADLPGGFYLIWGATPGRRLDGEGGPLSGFRIDAARLAQTDASGDNVYATQRLVPDSDPSLPNASERVSDATALLAPSLALARSLGGRRLTLRTNIEASTTPDAEVAILGVDQERAFELKYAARPYPLASVLADVNGDGARVVRAMEFGPLHAAGSVELWVKGLGGAWRLDRIVSRYSY